jgi:hypothetical protein
VERIRSHGINISGAKAYHSLLTNLVMVSVTYYYISSSGKQQFLGLAPLARSYHFFLGVA